MVKTPKHKMETNGYILYFEDNRNRRPVRTMVGRFTNHKEALDALRAMQKVTLNSYLVDNELVMAYSDVPQQKWVIADAMLELALGILHPIQQS